MRLQKGDKIAIVVCSNAQPIAQKSKIEELIKVIKKIGLMPICSNYIFEKYSIFSGEAKERAKALMEFYSDKDIKAIFDISGGNVANEILEYLDFHIIKENWKPFFGYSDLTTIINAIYAKTGEAAYLYQIRNLIYDQCDIQEKRFINSLFCGEKDLFDIKYSFIQGNNMEGVIVGGNVRCLLKLAGTPYMPDFENKILFLEARGGDVGLITTFFNQLTQMGVFKKINGILLGTFTKMEENNFKPTVEEILMNVLEDKNIPVAKTKEVGHGSDSKCLKIGKFISL